MSPTTIDNSNARNCDSCRLAKSPDESICDGAAKIALQFLNVQGGINLEGEVAKDVIERHLWQYCRRFSSRQRLSYS